MTGDIGDIKAYLDDKIADFAELEKAAEGIPAVHSMVTIASQQTELIRKDLERIEVEGYTSRNPETGDHNDRS